MNSPLIDWLTDIGCLGQLPVHTERSGNKNLNANVEPERMNVPVSSEAKQSRKYATEAHPDGKKVAQICSLGNMSADTNQSQQMPHNALIRTECYL